MTPAALAALHARCFTSPPPWSAQSFADLLASPHVVLHSDPQGRAFALVQVIAGEAELLTLATDPDARRQGLARALLDQAHQALRDQGVSKIFLEVAEINTAARALYEACGYAQTGTRPGYYVGQDGSRVTALILCKSLL